MMLLLLLFLSYRVQSMESMVAGTAAMHGTTTHWPHRISATPPHIYEYKYKEVVLLLLRKTFMHYILYALEVTKVSVKQYKTHYRRIY